MGNRVEPIREWFELDDGMLEDRPNGIYYLLGTRCRQYKSGVRRNIECVEITGATEDERHQKLMGFVDRPNVHKPASVVEALRAALGEK